MCLTPITIPQIAEEDILVFKYGHFGKCNETFYPKHNPNYQYANAKIVETTIRINRLNEVENGYHAYYALNNEIKSINRNQDCALFMIPQGATYIIGNNNDIVSNRIAFIGDAFDFKRFNKRFRTLKQVMRLRLLKMRAKYKWYDNFPNRIKKLNDLISSECGMFPGIESVEAYKQSLGTVTMANKGNDKNLNYYI